VWFVGSIALVAGSLVAYQLAQRSISGGSNPWLPLLVAYVVGAVICAGGLAFTSRSLGAGEPLFTPGSVLLGLAVVGIEFGYLQAHRAGWNIAAVGLVGSTAGTVLLGIVGFLMLDEPLSWLQLAGIGVCVAGLSLLVIGQAR
jgi:drug/metabolite transporter (DMT)-like permease